MTNRADQEAEALHAFRQLSQADQVEAMKRLFATATPEARQEAIEILRRDVESRGEDTT
jgi:predicted helicase